MNSLEERVYLAKNNHIELDRLIDDYIGFIKNEVAKFNNLSLDFDDRLSIAMLSFANSIKSYDKDKGKFISFASLNIRNRIIDFYRKEEKHIKKVIPLFEDETIKTNEEKIAIEQYNIAEEQNNLKLEIESFTIELNKFDINLENLALQAAKQKRSRELCIKIAKTLVNDEDMKQTLLNNRQLPQSQLAKELKVSKKTIEKYRKYIIAICIILIYDFPLIKSFLAYFKEVR